MPSTTSKARTGTAGEGFTDDERAAMKERARETRKRSTKADPAQDERDVMDKIAEMPDDDRALAQLVHDVVTRTAPQLTPRTWYGMPAYALDGKVLCWFKPGSKFKSRYATVGFSDVARLDDGDLWPTEYAVTATSKGVEKRLAELIAAAVG